VNGSITKDIDSRSQTTKAQTSPTIAAVLSFFLWEPGLQVHASDGE
jgi:hypothetical protein